MKERYKVLPRTLVLIIKEGKVLLMKYSGTDSNGMDTDEEKRARKDLYNGIGGHVEENETVIQNAIKESQEEASLTPTEVRLRGVMNINNVFGKNVMLYVVAATSDTWEVKGAEEGEPEWVNISDIDNYNVFEDIKVFINKILETDEFFTGRTIFDDKDKIVSMKFD